MIGSVAEIIPFPIDIVVKTDKEPTQTYTLHNNLDRIALAQDIAVSRGKATQGSRYRQTRAAKGEWDQDSDFKGAVGEVDAGLYFNVPITRYHVGSDLGVDLVLSIGTVDVKTQSQMREAWLKVKKYSPEHTREPDILLYAQYIPAHRSVILCGWIETEVMRQQPTKKIWLVNHAMDASHLKKVSELYHAHNNRH